MNIGSFDGLHTRYRRDTETCLVIAFTLFLLFNWYKNTSFQWSLACASIARCARDYQNGRGVPKWRERETRVRDREAGFTWTMESHLIYPCHVYYLSLAWSFLKNVVKMIDIIISVFIFDVVDSRVDTNEIRPDNSWLLWCMWVL